MPDRPRSRILYYLTAALLTAVLAPLLLALLYHLDRWLVVASLSRTELTLSSIFQNNRSVALYLLYFVSSALLHEAVVLRWPWFQHRNRAATLALPAMAATIIMYLLAAVVLFDSRPPQGLRSLFPLAIAYFVLALPLLLYTHLMRSLMLRLARLFHQIVVFLVAIAAVVAAQGYLFVWMSPSSYASIFLLLAAFVLCILMPGGLAQLLFRAWLPITRPSENPLGGASEMSN